MTPVKVFRYKWAFINTFTDTHVCTWSTEVGGLHYMVKVWKKNILSLAERMNRRNEDNKTWYFGLSALALCLRTVVKLENCGTQHNRRDPGTQTPHNVFFFINSSSKRRWTMTSSHKTQPKTRA